jgi:hypothetical protein
VTLPLSRLPQQLAVDSLYFEVVEKSSAEVPSPVRACWYLAQGTSVEDCTVCSKVVMVRSHSAVAEMRVEGAIEISMLLHFLTQYLMIFLIAVQVFLTSCCFAGDRQ